MSAVATPLRTNTPQSTSERPIIPLFDRSSRARTGDGVTSTRSRLSLALEVHNSMPRCASPKAGFLRGQSGRVKTYAHRKHGDDSEDPVPGRLLGFLRGHGCLSFVRLRLWGCEFDPHVPPLKVTSAHDKCCLRSCHKNVIQMPTKSCKLREERESGKGKQLAPVCCNLLVFLVWRRSRQDLVNLDPRLRTRRSGVRISPGAPFILFSPIVLGDVYMRDSSADLGPLGPTHPRFLPED